VSQPVRFSIRKGAASVSGDASMTLHPYTVAMIKNASDFVLTTFQRIEGGEARSDPKVIDIVRHMFFRI
jgi:hypothetical protein